MHRFKKDKNGELSDDFDLFEEQQNETLKKGQLAALLDLEKSDTTLNNEDQYDEHGRPEDVLINGLKVFAQAFKHNFFGFKFDKDDKDDDILVPYFAWVSYFTGAFTTQLNQSPAYYDNGDNVSSDAIQEDKSSSIEKSSRPEGAAISSWILFQDNAGEHFYLDLNPNEPLTRKLLTEILLKYHLQLFVYDLDTQRHDKNKMTPKQRKILYKTMRALLMDPKQDIDSLLKCEETVQAAVEAAGLQYKDLNLSTRQQDPNFLALKEIWRINKAFVDWENALKIKIDELIALASRKDDFSDTRSNEAKETLSSGLYCRLRDMEEGDVTYVIKQFLNDKKLKNGQSVEQQIQGISELYGRKIWENVEKGSPLISEKNKMKLHADYLLRELNASLDNVHHIPQGWTTKKTLDNLQYPMFSKLVMLGVMGMDILGSNAIARQELPLWALLMLCAGLTAAQAYKWHDILQRQHFKNAPNKVPFGEKEKQGLANIGNETLVFTAQAAVIALAPAVLLSINGAAFCPEEADEIAWSNMMVSAVAVLVPLMLVTWAGKKYFHTEWTKRDMWVPTLALMAGVVSYLSPLSFDALSVVEVGGDPALNSSRMISLVFCTLLYFLVTSPSGYAERYNRADPKTPVLNSANSGSREGTNNNNGMWISDEEKNKIMQKNIGNNYVK